jgi:predicted negative regulator of RcsB-dependent stress response
MTQFGARRRTFRSEPQILDDKIKQLREGCGTERDGALLRLMLAQALVEANRREDAMIELRWSLKFDPTYIAAYRMVGLTAVKLGGIERAVWAFKKGIKIAIERDSLVAAQELRRYLRRLNRL